MLFNCIGSKWISGGTVSSLSNWNYRGEKKTWAWNRQLIYKYARQHVLRNHATTAGQKMTIENVLQWIGEWIPPQVSTNSQEWHEPPQQNQWLEHNSPTNQQWGNKIMF